MPYLYCEKYGMKIYRIAVDLDSDYPDTENSVEVSRKKLATLSEAIERYSEAIDRLELELESIQDPEERRQKEAAIIKLKQAVKENAFIYSNLLRTVNFEIETDELNFPRERIDDEFDPEEVDNFREERVKEGLIGDDTAYNFEIQDELADERLMDLRKRFQ